MRQIVFICMSALISLSFSIEAQQSSDTNFFDQSGFDKVVISDYLVRDKASSWPGEENPVDVFEKKSARELTRLEVSRLFKHIRNSLRNEHSNDSQQVFIDFYSGDHIVQKLSFSFNTGNIRLKKEGCERKTNGEFGTSYNPCLYLGNANSDFITFILELLEIEPNDALEGLLERSQ